MPPVLPKFVEARSLSSDNTIPIIFGVITAVLMLCGLGWKVMTWRRSEAHTSRGAQDNTLAIINQLQPTVGSDRDLENGSEMEEV